MSANRRFAPEQRLDMKYEVREDGCWQWTGSIDRNGYGSFWFNKTMALAHRVSYELKVGPIPEGMQLDHLCRNRSCVNPAHLEPVTARENTHRSPITFANKTHCPKGHAYDEANTYVRPSDGRRRCRTCMGLRLLEVSA